tara:strand:- start:205 stop:867 length:663 start_codon:yes stop_codon:yes gene_type:complete
MKQLSDKVGTAARKVLFLGYNQKQTKLIEALISDGHEVWHCDHKITCTDGYDIAISFGYKYILKENVVNNNSCPVVNLHISYLPYNRGCHPNFWSFFDGTPSGVTIHLVDKGIDTGDILFQKYVNFSVEEKTFSQAYKRLVSEIEALFIKNKESIISKNFKATPQRGKGTYHELANFPKEFGGWDLVVSDEIDRLDNLLGGQIDQKLKVIDEIKKSAESE